MTELGNDWKVEGELYGDVRKVELNREVSKHIDIMRLMINIDLKKNKERGKHQGWRK